MTLSDSHSWHSSAVADLAFILLSPSLIARSDSSLTLNEVDTLKWLKKLDQQPQKLIDFLQNEKPKKLGWYAEKLMQYFFMNYPDFKLWGNNIQLFNGKVTTGEIDFILEDLESGQLIQVELATKFYLFYTDEANNKSTYIGPNARDSFKRKYLHLMNNQLLTKTPSEVEKLTKGRTIDFTVPWVKGVLFYPINQKKKPTIKTWVAPNHLSGWYCYYTDLLESNIQTLKVYKKMDWLSIHSGVLIAKSEFKDYFRLLFEEGHQAIMVTNSEGQRGFIMADSWPSMA